MKTELKKLTLLSAALLLFAVPAFADEASPGSRFEQGQQEQKNECMLVASATGCGADVDTSQNRIDRIQREINRGTDVYTTDELKALNKKLEDEKRFREDLFNISG